MPYHPHIKTKKDNHKLLTLIISVVAIVSPIMTVPQVYQIFNSQTAAGVSPISWFAYTITSIIWFYYGIIHKEKPIIVNSVIGGILSACVLFGALLF
jgi:uncharacterized protein with PQ loop repeat